MVTPPHPATFSPQILAAIDALIPDGARVLDPFAGVGTIHRLRPRIDTWGLEIEHEWGAASPYTLVGDARDLPWPDDAFDYVATSPCYGNRMADHHEARDASRRITYRHYLGRALTPTSSGKLQWGTAYRELHDAAWWEAKRVARHLILNVKDHVRRDVLQRVPEWHLATCRRLGWELTDEYRIPVSGMRFGENHGARADHEMIYVFRRGSDD